MNVLRRRPRASPWLIVGLGNPGARYARNRHNVGFMVVDGWARRHGIEVQKRRPRAVQGEGTVSVEGTEHRVLVARPRTYMNLSGEAVGELMQRYHVGIERLIVVYDDMDLPLGKLRVRERGSSGGHNGIGSIIERLQNDGFLRVRVGIGRPVEDVRDAADYVLDDFTGAEREVVETAIHRACDALDSLLVRGPAATMDRFNAG